MKRFIGLESFPVHNDIYYSFKNYTEIMKIPQKFRQNPAFKSEIFDNEILLYAMSDATGIYLNETASLVWELCSKNYSIADITGLLEEAYPLQKKTIGEDVVSAIESLVMNRVLIPQDD